MAAILGAAPEVWLVSGHCRTRSGFARQHGPFGRAPFVAHVLEAGAQPIFGYHRVSQREQGRGFLHLPKAANLMENMHVWPPRDNRRHLAQRNHDLRDGPVTANFPDLIPGQTFSFNLKVAPGTQMIEFAFPAVRKRGK